MAFSTPRINRASPFFRPSSSRARSPTRDEQSLSLRQVIGTTATSINGFSTAESRPVFAFIAGSGGVVVTLGKDFQTSQRFFHSRPNATPLVSTPSVYDSPTPVGHQGARQRTAASLRESGYGVPSQSSPFNESFESPSGKSGNQSRTKAATCIALSPDAKLVAIGETGHKPRVLIFPTGKDEARDIPQNALAEHTFGVRCLAFSPDASYLASLGDINDGFLYIWSISQRYGTANLKASNKCTSNIRQIAWMGNDLVTVGTRHVKIWRLEQPASSPSKRFSDASFALGSPSSRILIGRNCLLGGLLDKTFTAVAAISHVQAIVCSDAGDVCLLDSNESTPLFNKIAETDFSVTAITVKPREYVLLAGARGQLKTLWIASGSGLLVADTNVELSDTNIEPPSDHRSSVMALGLVNDMLISVEHSRGLKIFDHVDGGEERVSFSLKQSFPAHGAAVLGIRTLPPESCLGAFMTWSADGTVLWWSSQGTFSRSSNIPLEQLNEQPEEYVNELKVVNTFCEGRYLVSGDRVGVLRVVESSSVHPLYDSKAHGNEVTDLAIYEGEHDVLIASASRDRTVQIFRWAQDETCEHVQTIEEHTAAVTSVLFSKDGNTLISASSDRTIMLLDAVPNRGDGKGRVVGFLARRPITLKAAPLSMQLSTEDDALIVSTTDRQVQKFDLGKVTLTSTFKTTDQDGGDAAMLGSVTEVPMSHKTSLIAGVATSDKSIRVYDAAGRLLGKEHGHTEGMMGIVLLPKAGEAHQGSSIATVASDGTIFVWDLKSTAQQLQDAFSSLTMAAADESPSRLLASRPPLRKVLSSSELTRLHGLREEDEPGKTAHSGGAKGPQLKRKTSKLSMMQTPKLDPPSQRVSRAQSTQPSPTAGGSTPQGKRTTSRLVRSPSPMSPARKSQTMRVPSTRNTPQPAPGRRKSMSAASSPAAPNALAVSTDSLCRSLHSYRKKLSSSSDILALDSVRELERELAQTAKALAEKSARHDTVMSKILDQYSERLVGLLDEKIEASVARQMGRRSESNESNAYEGNEVGGPE